MPIYRKPKGNLKDVEPISLSKDEEAERFIEKALNQPVKQSPPPAAKRAKKEAIIVRVDPAILDKIDAAAKKRGISRAAWINAACTRTLELEND